MNHSFYNDMDGGKYISTPRFQKESGDELERYWWGGLQLVFKFTSEPKGPIDALL